MSLKGYETFVFAWSWFSHTCQANSGKNSCGVDISFSLSAVTYLIMHEQYFALINLNIDLQLTLKPVSPFF